jgi:hypothetical protein
MTKQSYREVEGLKRTVRDQQRICYTSGETSEHEGHCQVVLAVVLSLRVLSGRHLF